MKRNRLEDLFRDKLEGLEISPPDNAWSRLEAGLADIRREEAFRADGGKAQPFSAPNVRKPQRRRMNWTYVAASVAACAVLMLVLYNVDRREAGIVSAVGGPAKDNTAVITGDDLAKITVENRTAAAGHEIAAGKGMAGTVAAAKRHTAADAGIAAEAMPVGEIVPVTEPMTILPIIPRQMNDAQVIVEEYAAGGDGEAAEASAEDKDDSAGLRGAGKDKRKTSDMKNRRVYAVDADAKAEYGKRSRRTAPVKSSLFMASLGGVSGTDKVPGGVVMSASDFTITEIAETPMQEAMIIKNKTVTENLQHDFPITFGVKIAVPVANNLSIQSGITYTYMKSESEQSGNATYLIKNKYHYVGIPVGVKFDFLNTNKVDLYVSGGTAFEKCVSFKQSRTILSNENIPGEPVKTSNKVKGLQASVGGSVGVELNVNSMIGVYAEPGINYYFKNSNQPESYRTENPLNFSLQAGVRFNL